MRKFAGVAKSVTAEITLTAKQRVREMEQEEKRLAATMIREARAAQAIRVRAEKETLAEHARVVRQKIAEDQRAQREIIRIERETARQAIEQQRIRERAAKQLADAQIREARRASRELETTVSGGGLQAILSGVSGVPGVGGAASQLSSVAGAATAVAGPAVVATAAIVGAVAALGSLAGAASDAVQGLFNLARRTAEFQGQLFDLSQQTGFSVETLSALEVVARTTGSSIESITASLGIFQKNLEESLNTNSEAAKSFQRLGVEVTNTEDTFRATLQALAKMPEGFRQTALALELFGRGGKAVLAILKESNGDIDSVIEKLRGFGLVTTEQARRADELNDQLVLLQVALRGFGTEAIPHATDALVKLQKTLNENKEGVDFLKGAIGFLAGSLSLQLTTAVKAGESVWKSHRTEVNLVVEAYQILRNAIRGAVAEIPAVSIPAPGGESGLELLKFLKQFGVPLKEKQDFSKIKGLFKETGEAKKTAAEREEEQLLKQRTEFVVDLQRELKRLIDQTKGIDVATRSYAVAQSVSNGLLAQASPKTIELAETTAKLIDRYTKIVGWQRQIIDFQKAQDEQIRINIEGERTHIEVADEFIKSLEKQGAVLQETTKFWIRFNGALLQALETADKLKQTALENLIPGPGAAGVSEATQILSAEQIEVLGEIPEPTILTMWQQAMIALQEQMVSFSDLARGTFIGVFHEIAGALAQGVAAWALYGQSFGKAMRQALAAVLAKISAEATYQALIHAAYAIGSLAFGDFAGAAKHGIAAAQFAAVAAATGIGARAVAGSAFSGATGGGTATAREPGQPLTTIITGRNQDPNPTVRHVVEVQVVNGELGPAINAHIVRNVGDGGELREVFQRDGR